MLKLTIITGLSGSGKTTAIQVLEDLGFFCVDNLPAGMVPDLLGLLAKENKQQVIGGKVAIVIDARGQSFLKEFYPFIRKLKNQKKARIVYLEASQKVLTKRYNSSRRPHPLSKRGSVREGVEKEKRVLIHLRQLADKIIDTSDLNVHELKQLLISYFHVLAPKTKTHISLMSFGYKYGLPMHADLIFDVRFLPNPFFIEKLKDKTGQSKAVKNYIYSQKAAQVFLKKIDVFLRFLVKEYTKEGKSYLTIAFGCTGGRHRSVAIAEKVKENFVNNKLPVKIIHRDSKVEG